MTPRDPIAVEPSSRLRSARDTQDPGIRIALIEERLEKGAESFTELRLAVAALKPPKTPAWPFVTFGFTVAMMIIGVIWQAARYPDRDEYERDMAGGAAQVRALEDELRGMKVEAAALRIRLDERDRTQATVADAIKQLGKGAKR